MSDPVTSNIRLAVPVHGSDVDAWDVPINGDMGIIDSCFGSVTAKSLTNTTVSLTETEAQSSILRFSGSITANINVLLPATIIKSWICENLTVSNAPNNWVLQVNAGSGRVVSLPPGSSQIYWDGTNVSFINLGKIGEYWDYVGSDVPSWISNSSVPPYLLCDGSTFSSGTYPLLAAILGGTTLPDFRGRSRSFLNGGTGRITTAGSGIDGNTRLSAGGLQAITITQPNLPAFSPAFTGTPQALGTIPLNSSVPSPTTQTVSPTTSGVFGAGPAFIPTITLPTYTPAGTIAPLGSASPLPSMTPTCIGGITMIRAA